MIFKNKEIEKSINLEILKKLNKIIRLLEENDDIPIIDPDEEEIEVKIIK